MAFDFPRVEEGAPVDVVDEFGERIVVEDMNPELPRHRRLEPVPVQRYTVLPSRPDRNELGLRGSARMGLSLQGVILTDFLEEGFPIRVIQYGSEDRNTPNRMIG